MDNEKVTLFFGWPEKLTLDMLITCCDDEEQEEDKDNATG